MANNLCVSKIKYAENKLSDILCNHLTEFWPQIWCYGYAMCPVDTLPSNIQ